MLLAAAFACLTGCAPPQLAAPGTDHPAIEITPVVTDSACRTILFKISSLSATFPTQGSCGSGLTEITPTGAIIRTMASPRRVYFRIRIKNHSSVPVPLPLRLVLPRSGIVVIGDGSVSQVTAFNPDTLRSDSTAVWLAGGTATLAVGGSTPVLEPILKVDLPVNQVRLNFQVLGEGLDLTPEGWQILTSAMPTFDATKTIQRPGTNIITYRTAAIIEFVPGTTVPTKQAFFAQNSMSVLGVNRSGEYFVKIPDPGTSISASDNYFALLSRKPEVLRASPVFQKGITPVIE